MLTVKHQYETFLSHQFGSLTLIILSFFITTGTNAACYFSAELQGTFVTQSTITHTNEVQYSEVNITEDSIPIWGNCYKRIDNNVILQIGSDETTCFRCFYLKLVSRNVLRVHAADKDYISKCYTNELKAMASCPTPEILKDRTRHTEIILYKTAEFDGQSIHREYCPINGKYRIAYKADDGSEDKMECSSYESELDNCPSGSAINLRFRKCSFENHEVTLECLGHWQDLDGVKYMALLNAGAQNKLGPQYRCATYTENHSNGVIQINFSKDSTCSVPINTIFNPVKNTKFESTNSEILTLFPNGEIHWQEQQYCNMPNWMHGHWKHMDINRDLIVYKDHSSFKTYTIQCIQNESNKWKQDSNNDEIKFIAFSRTQCGEEQYHCLWAIKRSANILEFQIGAKIVQNISDAMNSEDNICNERYFDENRWLTQSRLGESLMISPCPVSGEFTGLLPDAQGLCAKLSSECQTRNKMFYQVSACEYDEIIEEREYICLGQWLENGYVYTYTQRVDVSISECFVGALHTNNRIFIKEAGEHCQRNINPNKYGMELRKTKFCNDKNDNSSIKYHDTDVVPEESTLLQISPDVGITNEIGLKKNHSNGYTEYTMVNSVDTRQQIDKSTNLNESEISSNESGQERKKNNSINNSSIVQINQITLNSSHGYITKNDIDENNGSRMKLSFSIIIPLICIVLLNRI